MSKIQDARNKLNEAESELISMIALKNSVEKNKVKYEDFRDIIQYTLDSVEKKKGGKEEGKIIIPRSVKITMKVGDTFIDYMFSNLSGESFGEFLAGLSGEFVQGEIVTIATVCGSAVGGFFSNGHPAGFIFGGIAAGEFVNVQIDKITNGGLDELAKNYYRRITGDDSTNISNWGDKIAKKIGVKFVNIKNGIISITTNEGTTYARPLRGYSGIVKGGPIATKSDVLFGGNGNDTLIGVSYGAGADMLIGGNGYDTYQVYGDNTIIDSDGKGKVELDGQVLTGGKWGGKKGVYINDDGAFKTYIHMMRNPKS